MKICVLLPSYEECKPPCPEYNDNWDPEYYFPKGQNDLIFERVLIGKASAYQQIRSLSTVGYDVFVNMCDGNYDEASAGAEVAQILEQFNLAFTGPTFPFYDTSKECQKMMAYYYGVTTPQYVIAVDETGIKEADQLLNYPMIVKHYQGHGSIGMTNKSRVHNSGELFEMAKTMIKKHGGALIEKFIEGREFTVLVAENIDETSEPITFTPVECIFLNGESFKHFDNKFVNLNNMKWTQCKDAALSTKLQEIAKKMFICTGGISYCRADFRVCRSTGEIYFLEINTNPGMFYIPPEDDPDGVASADLILREDKVKHSKFLKDMIACAIRRAANRAKKCEVRYKPKVGYALYAKMDIKVGEIIIRNEAKPHATPFNIKTESSDILKKMWFGDNALPTANNVWAIWSNNHNDWLQINFSTDPNACIDGLSLVAKRLISMGEQINLGFETAA